MCANNSRLWSIIVIHFMVCKCISSNKIVVLGYRMFVLADRNPDIVRWIGDNRRIWRHSSARSVYAMSFCTINPSLTSRCRVIWYKNKPSIRYGSQFCKLFLWIRAFTRMKQSISYVIVHISCRYPTNEVNPVIVLCMYMYMYFDLLYISLTLTIRSIQV